MRQSKVVKVYFSKHELSDALELYMEKTHPAILSHFAEGCDFDFITNPNTNEFVELVVNFRAQNEQVAFSGYRAPRIFSRQK